MRRRVVITGVGAVTPLGLGARTLFSRWAAGEVGIADGEAACSWFDPASVLGTKLARRTDRFAQFALVASDEAVADAGWGGPGSPAASGSAGDSGPVPDSGSGFGSAPYDPARIGCVIGTGIGGIGTIEAQQDVLRDRGPARV